MGKNSTTYADLIWNVEYPSQFSTMSHAYGSNSTGIPDTQSLKRLDVYSLLYGPVLFYIPYFLVYKTRVFLNFEVQKFGVRLIRGS